MALVFLDDVRPPIRKSAAKAVILLNPKTCGSPSLGLSHNVNQGDVDDASNNEQAFVYSYLRSR